MRVVQCVADWETSRVGYRHARRVQLIFFVSFRRHAQGERFLIVQSHLPLPQGITAQPRFAEIP